MTHKTFSGQNKDVGISQYLFLQFGPVVAEGNEAHVHHLLIYLCEGINDTHVGISGECEEGLPEELDACRGGTLIAAWAVGGEVSSHYNHYSGNSE